MQIKTVGDGPFVDIAVSGGTVSIGGVAIDCPARQEDGQVVVDVKHVGGALVEGAGGALVASVIIPAKEYEMVDSGKVDPDSGEPIMDRVAVALDANRVVIKLWPYVAKKEAV